MFSHGHRRVEVKAEVPDTVDGLDAVRTDDETVGWHLVATTCR
jgi:hypothetical protein